MQFFLTCLFIERGLFWAYFCSDLVPNLAILTLLRTLTSATPGSSLTVVVGELNETTGPGARVCHKPQRSFFESCLTLSASFNSKELSARGIGFVNFVWRKNRETYFFLFSVDATSSIHLSRINSFRENPRFNGNCMCVWKWFENRSYVKFVVFDVLLMLTCGIFVFLPKCAK